MAERPARPVLVLHPFLFAVLPVLFLFSHNARNLYVSPAELGLPLAVAVGVPFLVWLGLRFALRSSTKAGMVVTLALVLFYSWGQLADALTAHVSWFRTWQLGALFSAILAAGCWFFVRLRSDLRKLTILLNLTLGIVCALQIGSSPKAFFGAGPARRPRAPAAPVPGPDVPDIYYIIPDGHARSDILREMYDYDNSEFTSGLRARGFFVADRARANYSQTYLSLGSALNMSYVDSLAQVMGPESDDRRPLEHWLLDNRVMHELRSRGYRIVSFSSGCSGTDFRDVDARFAPWWMPTEFQALVISTTPVGTLLAVLGRRTLHGLHRDRVEYILSQLPAAARGRGPAFVFAHVVCPHPPFVFGPSGEMPESVRPFFTLVDGSAYHEGKPGLVAKYVKLYAGQTHYVDGCLLRVIDDILASSERPALVVLHADHGPRSQMTRDDPYWTFLAEGQSILYAVLMPDRDYSGWHDSITPVNTFRLVFDRLFDDTLSILPDRSYFATWARPYEYYDVDAWQVPEAKARQ